MHAGGNHIGAISLSLSLSYLEGKGFQFVAGQ